MSIKSKSQFLRAASVILCQLVFGLVIETPGYSGLSASFSGGQFIACTPNLNYTFNSSQLQFPRFVSLKFRTQWAPAFLFISHSSIRSLSLRLSENGSLILQHNNGNGFLSIWSSTCCLNDNKWHQVNISLLYGSSYLDVDAVRMSFIINTRDIVQDTSIPYVAIGSSGILGGEHENRAFVGCLSDIQLNGVDPLVAAYSQQFGFKNHGNILFTCSSDDQGVVTFMTSQSYISGPPLIKGNLSFSFEYRTSERDALLVYSELESTEGGNSHMAFSIDDGRLRIEVKLNGLCKKQCFPYPEVNLNDGLWHHIQLSTSQNGYVSLLTDGGKEYFIPDAHVICPVGSLLIGSVGIPRYMGISGFIGCVKNLMVNSMNIDIVGQASWGRGLVTGCWKNCTTRHHGHNCEMQAFSQLAGLSVDTNSIGRWSDWSEWSATCSNYASPMVDQWRRRQCADSVYCIGQSEQVHTCFLQTGDFSNGYDFSGSTYIQYKYPPSIRPLTIRDQINIVFRTRSNNSLLMLITSSVNTSLSDYLSISVNRLRQVDVCIGHGNDTPIVLTSEETVSDGYQHSVSVTRYGTFISISINNSNTQSMGRDEALDLVVSYRDQFDIARSRNPRVSHLYPFMGCLLHLSVNGLDLLSSTVDPNTKHMVDSNVTMGTHSMRTTTETPTLLSVNQSTPLVPKPAVSSAEFGPITIGILATGGFLLISMIIAYFICQRVKKRRHGVYETNEGSHDTQKMKRWVKSDDFTRSDGFV